MWTAEQSRAWRKANPDKDREYSRRWRENHPGQNKLRDKKRKSKMTAEEKLATRLWYPHGLTVENYEQMWLDQDNKCYLCEYELKRGRSTHIDHDHRCCPKGKSCQLCRRGLTHNACNLIVGWAKDSPALLRIIAGNLEQKLI